MGSRWADQNIWMEKRATPKELLNISKFNKLMEQEGIMDG